MFTYGYLNFHGTAPELCLLVLRSDKLTLTRGRKTMIRGREMEVS